MARAKFGTQQVGAMTPEAATTSGGAPLMIDIHLVDEDPEQPRTKDNPGFSVTSIAELAASYGPKGPKSPISLRDNPDAPGRFIINHGSRRYRAARLKGLTIIPSFIDNDYHQIDQVIENLQRDALTAREIADWIGRELARGLKKREIAKSIGKSPSFVSQHATLLDLPDPIADVFNAGRVNDVTVVNELVTAFKKNPNEVASWLTVEHQDVTRSEVKLLREFLDEKRTSDAASIRMNEEVCALPEAHEPAAYERRKKVKLAAPDTDVFRKVIVQVEHGARLARLILTRRPPTDGHAWLKYEDDGHEFEVNLDDVKLVALLEG